MSTMQILSLTLVVLLFLLVWVLVFMMASHDAKDQPKVDPWLLQQKLMRISDQEMPALPEINSTSLLYWALMLEEQSETGRALFVALKNEWATSRMHLTPPAQQSILRNIVDISDKMNNNSLLMREILADCAGIPWHIRLSDSYARPLLDGITDMAVVNAGFSVACGLPGASGYLNVQTSNLSKANPDTGLIDKHADGKWIKGREYKEPDLKAVLVQQRKEHDALRSERNKENTRAQV